MKELDELQKDLQYKLSKLNHDAHTTDLSNSGTEELRATISEALSQGAARAADKLSEPVTLNPHLHEAASEKPHGISTTVGRGVSEQDRPTEPVGGHDFTRSDLETKLQSVDERSVVGGEEPYFKVFEGRDPAVGLRDSPVVTRETRFEGKDDTPPREFAARVKEDTQEGNPTAEHCTSDEDSDSLEEITYMNDNTTERYTQEKDSWISTDEEETQNHSKGTPPENDNHLASAPDVSEAIHYITSLDPTRHGFSSGLDGDDCERGEDFLDKADQLGNNGEKNTAIDEEDFEGSPRNLEEKSEPHRTSGCAVSNGAVSELNSSNEREVHNTQPSVPALPNFFMPTEQLEQSMRAIRLAASFQSAAPGLEDTTRSKSKLLSRTGVRSKPVSGSSEIAEEFAKRKLVYRERGDPPISSSEAQRIARIFSSNPV